MLMLGREEWGGRCILYVEDDESYTTFGDVSAGGLARLPYRLAVSLSMHLLSYHNDAFITTIYARSPTPISYAAFDVCVDVQGVFAWKS